MRNIFCLIQKISHILTLGKNGYKLSISTLIHIFDTAFHIFILLLLFLFFNKGFGNAIPPREALPEEWSAEETDRFYEKLLRDKKIARRILIFLIPLLLVFLIDSLVLFLPGLLCL